MDRSPPAAPLGFTVGITGHRMVDGGAADRLMAQVTAVLQALGAAVHGAPARASDAVVPPFSPDLPRLRLLSPLAPGADQLAAQAALDAGWEVAGILPFAREDYGGMLDGAARAGLLELAARAGTLLELPGDPARAVDAYHLAGRVTLAHSDVLLAIWDEEPARGRGGTGEVVEAALEADTPVLLFDPAGRASPRLLRFGKDRPATDEEIAALAAALVDPPAPPFERQHLQTFLLEGEQRTRKRLEYPLLLQLTGVKRLTRSALRVPAFRDAARADWAPFRERCGPPHGLVLDVDALEHAYCWADGLAQHFAQSHRSGHVFNFAMGALAILLALTSLIWADGKYLLAGGEFVVILAIVANTRLGLAAAWHRRWLDYRQLAERLRPMRSLSLLAAARPPPAARDRWADWYARAWWRRLGLPAGSLDLQRATALATVLGQEELLPQVAYHEASAALAHRLDHRLHRIGLALFLLTCVSCVLLIAALAFAPVWAKAHAEWFVLASAGLPALGTASFGIRVQGDFGGTAHRSRATAAKLRMLAAELGRGPPLARAAKLFERAAAAMIADLDEWRAEHQKHELALP